MKLLFETDRLLVRNLSQKDADNFFMLNSDEEVMRFIRPVKSRNECDAFLNENINLYQQGSVIGRYAVIKKITNNFIGSFSFLHLSVKEGYHIGYALLPPYWGNGFAQELLKEGCLFFFSATNRKELFAITQTENTASKNALIKSGFSATGIIAENNKQVDLFCISKEL